MRFGSGGAGIGSVRALAMCAAVKQETVVSVPSVSQAYLPKVEGSDSSSGLKRCTLQQAATGAVPVSGLAHICARTRPHQRRDPPSSGTIMMITRFLPRLATLVLLALRGVLQLALHEPRAQPRHPAHARRDPGARRGRFPHEFVDRQRSRERQLAAVPAQYCKYTPLQRVLLGRRAAR